MEYTENRLHLEVGDALFDCIDGAVEYISSTVLRALLYFQQTPDEVNGTLTVRNVPRIVMTIFEVTDFNSIIKIV